MEKDKIGIEKKEIKTENKEKRVSKYGSIWKK